MADPKQSNYKASPMVDQADYMNREVAYPKDHKEIEPDPDATGVSTLDTIIARDD